MHVVPYANSSIVVVIAYIYVDMLMEASSRSLICAACVRSDCDISRVTGIN